MIDAEALARDVAAVVQVPSVTGDERAVLERFAAIAERLGLPAELIRHDLVALRKHPGHPGEEAPRHELWGLEVVGGAAEPRGRLCLNGHVDVVGPGEQHWERGPFSGAIEGGYVHGRGSADMKGGVVAALHALAAAGRRRAGAGRRAGGRVGGGRRPRHVRGARARRPLRRRAHPRADRPRRSRARRRAR